MAERKQGREADLAGNGLHPEAGEAADASEADEVVLTLVCLTCGKEYYFSEEPSEGISCEKCAGSVFRSFYSREGDEAADDFSETTGRDLDPDDAEGEALPGDVLDLDLD